MSKQFLWKIALNKTVLSQPIQFSSIWSIERTLSDASPLGQSWPGSDGNKGVLGIPQSSSITGASLSDYLQSNLGHSLEESYPSVEMQSVYSITPSDLASIRRSISQDFSTQKLGVRIIDKTYIIVSSYMPLHIRDRINYIYNLNLCVLGLYGEISTGMFFIILFLLNVNLFSPQVTFFCEQPSAFVLNTM